MKDRGFLISAAFLSLLLCFSNVGLGQTIQPPFSANYLYTNLGSVPGLPANYGGMSFKRGDANTLLIGGSANNGSGEFYSIGLVRGTNQHIIGFTNSAAFFCAGPDNDGGLAYGPNGVLFYTLYPDNELAEIKPGDTNIDKLLDLTTLGVTASTGAVGFVPSDFAGAGKIVFGSYSGGQFFSTTVTSDSTGTYDPGTTTAGDTGFSGPEGFIYVPAGSPLFIDHQSMLLDEYGSGQVSAFLVDTNGLPIVASRQLFITGLSGAEGAAVDPLTGDFLFSTFGGGDQIVEVQGFGVPLPADLEVDMAVETNTLLCCGSLTYYLTVTNHGPAPASDVSLSETLPASALLYGTLTSQGAVVTNGNQLTWNLGILLPNAAAKMQVTAQFKQAGVVTNFVSVTSDESDTNLANNLTNLTTTINAIPPRTLVLDAGPGQVLNLCWGNDNVGFNLESNSNLLAPGAWQTFTNGITNVGSVNNLVLSNYTSPSSLFFRLHKKPGGT